MPPISRKSSSSIRKSVAALCLLSFLVIFPILTSRPQLLHDLSGQTDHNNSSSFASFFSSPIHALLHNAISDLNLSSVPSGFGGNSGSVVELVRLRKFTSRRLPPLKTLPKYPRPSFLKCNASRWAVFTTIFEPSRTVRQLSALRDQGWCTIVIGDLKSPPTFDAGPGVLYVSPEMQRTLPYALVKSTPWNHFGRKALGFLLAISGGAEVIYDTDDDNELINDTLPDPLHANFSTIEHRDANFRLFNPYTEFGGLSGVWPRGFPLEAVRYTGAGFYGISKSMLKPEQVGVVQLLADVDPDLDAIYRMTGKLPLKLSPQHDNVAVGAGALAPYNAQATFVMKRAFWSLLLPITVPGRVSDIWRGYFYQPVMWNADLRLVFHKHAVNHIRSPHRLAADFQAELDLYSKSDALTRLLLREKLEGKTVPEQMEEQIIRMYEYGLVEEGDVKLVQDWIQDLVRLNYPFPEIVTGNEGWGDGGDGKGAHFEVRTRIEDVLNKTITAPRVEKTKKNLVVVTGYYRVPEIGWQQFEKLVLKPLDADLATVVSMDASGHYHDEFFLRFSKYSLVYNDKDWKYRDALRQIAALENVRLGPKFFKKQLEVEGNWAGCIEEEENSPYQVIGSGMCQIVNKYIAYLLLQRNLHMYDNVVLLRSDVLFTKELNFNLPSQSRGYLKVMDWNGYCGYNDRMLIMNQRAARDMLQAASRVVKDENFMPSYLEKFYVPDINHEKFLMVIAWASDMEVEKSTEVPLYLVCSSEVQTRRMGCRCDREMGCYKYRNEPELIKAKWEGREIEVEDNAIH